MHNNIAYLEFTQSLTKVYIDGKKKKFTQVYTSNINLK